MKRCTKTAQQKHPLQVEMAINIPRWIWILETPQQAIKEGERLLANPETHSPILILEHGERLCMNNDPRGIEYLQHVQTLLQDTENKNRCKHILEKHTQ